MPRTGSPEAAPSEMEHPGHSRNSGQPMIGQGQTVQKIYTCSMHPEVVQEEAGTCPKCGMRLVEKEMFTCTMHPEVIQVRPGICPECGMKLIKKKDLR